MNGLGATMMTSENVDIIVGVDGDGKDGGHHGMIFSQKLCECLTVRMVRSVI